MEAGPSGGGGGGGSADLLEEAREAAATSGHKSSPGVVFLSSVPPGMGVEETRALLSTYGELGRIFLKPRAAAKKGKAKARDFDEGWVEFRRKKIAKRVAATLNRAPVGGKRRALYYDSLWNLKYLHGFKWVHLDEQLRFEAEVRKARLRNEISAVKRKAAAFAAQIEKGAHLRKLEETVLKKGGVWEKYQKQIAQKGPARRKSDAKNKESNKDLLDMIMGE